MDCNYEKCANEVETPTAKYCSVRCSNRDSIYTRQAITKICPECNAEFTVDYTNKVKVYCSSSCAAKFNNKRRVKKDRRCLGCGKEFPAGQNYSKVYCDKSCKTNHRVEQWISGEWDGTVRDGLSSTIRQYLLESAGYKCQDGRSGCNGWGGFNPKSQKSCLTIDHIDGDCYNNKVDNLIVMCPNCHSMTETYGALNKGNGRMLRRGHAPVA